MNGKLNLDTLAALLGKAAPVKTVNGFCACGSPLDSGFLQPALSGKPVDFNNFNFSRVKLADIDQLEETLSDYLCARAGMKQLYNRLAQCDCGASAVRGFC